MPTKYETNLADIRSARLTKPEKEVARIRPTARARREVYEKFQAHTDEVLERLLSILRDDEADHTAVIAAGKEILARGWGSVPQHHVIEAMFEHRHVIDVDALRQLPADDLTRLEASLSRLIEIPDAEVIDKD
jgi:hypothetical protein